MEGALEVYSQKLSTSRTARPGSLAELGLSSARAPRSCPSSFCVLWGGRGWGWNLGRAPFWTIRISLCFIQTQRQIPEIAQDEDQKQCS